jgi:hypothetical protein
MEEKKKMTVYVGKNVAVYITESTSGDMGAFVAQEITLEPKQAVEGLDALGSDTIEEWAAGLKTYEGTIKEPLMDGEDGETQFTRMSALQEDLIEYEMQLKFSNPSGDISISFTGVIFADVSISSPKNKPAMLTTRFRAKTAAIDEPEA